MTRLEIMPVTVAEARRIVKRWHRHLPEVQGGLFASSVHADGECVGVGVAANPPRVWQGMRRIVIGRVAALDARLYPHARNACSMLYGSLCRASAALGYREAWTYSLSGESDESIRGAGFLFCGMSEGGEHDRPSRRRAPAVRPEPKKRWMRSLVGPTPHQLELVELAERVS